MDMELRFTDANFVSDEDGTLTVSGYVNETNTHSNVLGTTKKFIEKIAKGTFSKALANRNHDVDFLAEHDKYKILASTRNDTLELVEDERGLFMKAKIVPTTFGKDYYELIHSGILRNMSFGFRVLKDNWKSLKPGLYERTITGLELIEVSVVRNPAYSSSTIAARGIDLIEDVNIPEEVEKENREMEKLYEALASLEARMGEFIDLMKEDRNKEVVVEEKTEVTEEVKQEKETEATEEEIVEETVKETEEEKKEETKEETEEPETVESETEEDAVEEDEADVEQTEDRSEVLAKSFLELRSILSELREKGEIDIES